MLKIDLDNSIREEGHPSEKLKNDPIPEGFE